MDFKDGKPRTDIITFADDAGMLIKCSHCGKQLDQRLAIWLPNGSYLCGDDYGYYRHRFLSIGQNRSVRR